MLLMLQNVTNRLLRPRMDCPMTRIVIDDLGYTTDEVKEAITHRIIVSSIYPIVPNLLLRAAYCSLAQK